MGPEGGRTLRDLVKLGDLHVLEARTAVSLREGDRVLYIPEGTNLDAVLEEVRAAVQVVILGRSIKDETLSVDVPGTNDSVSILQLPRMYGTDQLPTGMNGARVKFYYMPPSGPIPEWRSREDGGIKTGMEPTRNVFAADSSRPNNPELDALVNSMKVVSHDVARLFYNWFKEPEVTISRSHGSINISAYDELGEALLDLLVTQLRIIGVDVNKEIFTQDLGTHKAMDDLYLIACHVLKESGRYLGRAGHVNGIRGVLSQNRIYQKISLSLNQSLD